MSSARTARTAIQDLVYRSLCKAEEVLIDLAKKAECLEEEEEPLSITGEVSSLEGASTQKSNSSAFSKKSEKRKKKKKRSKVMLKNSSSKGRSSSKKKSEEVRIAPPKETNEEDKGVSVDFTLKLENPGGEKKKLAFRIDCVNFKPKRACIGGQWKDIRPE